MKYRNKRGWTGLPFGDVVVIRFLFNSFDSSLHLEEGEHDLSHSDACVHPAGYYCSWSFVVEDFLRARR